MNRSILLGGLLAVCVATSPALADINIGVTLPITGPASALGVPEKNALALLPTTLAGEKINWILLDDATDPTLATKNSRKLVTESNVDLLMGSSTVPTCLAVAEVAIETKTPLIAIAPMDLPQEKNYWIFRTPQHVRLMAKAVADDMKARGFKEVGFIGYTDAWGETWLKEMTPLFESMGMKFSVVERYARNDTSVTGQVLKLVAANPPAILIVGSGTPSALPQTALAERGRTPRQEPKAWRLSPGRRSGQAFWWRPSAVLADAAMVERLPHRGCSSASSSSRSDRSVSCRLSRSLRFCRRKKTIPHSIAPATTTNRATAPQSVVASDPVFIVVPCASPFLLCHCPGGHACGFRGASSRRSRAAVRADLNGVGSGWRRLPPGPRHCRPHRPFLMLA